jgi:hypothetical protein
LARLCDSCRVSRLVPTRAELRGALAGAVAIGLAYSAGRRHGLARSDLARTLAPGNPVAGRALQLALGALASLPGARSSTPARALAGGAALGALASREGRAFSAGAHALAALVAQRVASRSG